MHDVNELFTKNQAWAERVIAEDPTFFQRLAKQQAPAYLWIGCADSRVPATQLVDLLPGEMFVHRNVANLVVHSDLNCLAVLQYAVDVLRVQHIIVCGHYGCGGVDAAYYNRPLGLIDNWLRPVQDIRNKHATLLSTYPDDASRCNLLCKLNVIEQAVNVGRTTILQTAWQRGQTIAIHGVVYGLSDGILRDAAISIHSPAEIAERYTHAISQLDQETQEMAPATQ